MANLVYRGGMLAVLPSPHRAWFRSSYPSDLPTATQNSDQGERVATLRKRLQVEGYLPSNFARLAGRESRFDSRLADAVARFQERHGLAVDGSVGPATLTALNVPVERRILQIQANLERYRWLPRDLGERYLVVNIPAFRLDAFEKGERVLSMAVVTIRPDST